MPAQRDLVRVKAMRAVGVFECPSWCAQDAEAEAELERHFGLWHDILTGGGPDGLLTVSARPLLAWTSAGPTGAYVDVQFTPTPDGTAWCLTPDDITAITEGLCYLREQAAGPDVWVWAYPGAYQDACDYDAREAS